MFKHKTCDTHAEKCIDQILDEVEVCEPDERLGRIKQARELAELNEVMKKNVEKKSKVDVNVIIKTVGTIIGVILLGNYEKTKIIPQKASQMFLKNV